MKTSLQALLLIGAVALSACTNADRFGKGAGAGAGGAGGAGGMGGIGGAGGISQSGLPSDPTSPAYFNQTIGNTVHFIVDQYNLTPEAQSILAKQAQWLVANPTYRAVIEGHADERGTRIYNINLGDRRANAVREYLISQGVQANRMTTISYGKERPIATCDEERCFELNRRAVTVITAGAGV